MRSNFEIEAVPRQARDDSGAGGVAPVEGGLGFVDLAHVVVGPCRERVERRLQPEMTKTVFPTTTLTSEMAL